MQRLQTDEEKLVQMSFTFKKLVSVQTNKIYLYQEGSAILNLLSLLDSHAKVHLDTASIWFSMFHKYL